MKKSYRMSRNIERSIMDAIEDQLAADGWESIAVEKVFPTDKQVPCILVQLATTTSEDLEIGSKTKRKHPLILLRIFADDDGQRLDLADWLFDFVKDGFDYYKIAIEVKATEAAKIEEKIYGGKIVVRRITRNEKEFENTEGLSKIDKYRHVIGLEVEVKES